MRIAVEQGLNCLRAHEGANVSPAFVVERERKVAFWENVEKALNVGAKVANFVVDSANSAAASGDPEIEGRKVSEWSRRWKPVGRLQMSADPMDKSELWRERNKEIGVYRLLLGGKVMYIGRAIEANNGGFRKRLSDYTRKGNSGRKHASGQKLHEYAQVLDVEIIPTNTAKGAVLLEHALVAKYRPEWNVIGSS